MSVEKVAQKAGRLLDHEQSWLLKKCYSGFRIDDTQKDTTEPINRAVRIGLITDYIKNNNQTPAKELKLLPWTLWLPAEQPCGDAF